MIAIHLLVVNHWVEYFCILSMFVLYVSTYLSGEISGWNKGIPSRSCWGEYHDTMREIRLVRYCVINIRELCRKESLRRPSKVILSYDSWELKCEGLSHRGNWTRLEEYHLCRLLLLPSLPPLSPDHGGAWIHRRENNIGKADWKKRPCPLSQWSFQLWISLLLGDGIIFKLNVRLVF